MIKLHTAAIVLGVSTVSVFAQKGGKAAGSGGVLGGMLPMMIVMFAIIYFLMIRPEQKKQKERLKMLSEIKKGDKIITSGGLHGIVQSVKDDIVHVKAGESVILQFSKSSITNIGSMAKGDSENKGK